MIGQTLIGSLDRKEVTTEKLISLGDSAELLLKSASVQAFVQDMSMSLYEAFVKAPPGAYDVLEDVRFTQKAISSLIAYLQAAVARRDKVTGNMPESQTDTERYRDRFFGLSGDPTVS